MELQTSSLRGFNDGNQRPWSPPGRPTVNTSGLARTTASSTPLELSPHLSSVSNSVTSSPWPQQLSLTNCGPSQSLPFMLQQSASQPSDSLGQHGLGSPTSGNEWGNMFSSPLDPSTFQALAASGVIPPSAGVPSSLPSGMNRPTHPFPMNSRDIHSSSGQSVPPQWSNVSSPYSSTPATSQRGSPNLSPAGSISQYPPSSMNMRTSGSAMPINSSSFDSHRIRRSSLSHNISRAHPANNNTRSDISLLTTGEGSLDNLTSGFSPTSPAGYGASSHIPSDRYTGLPPSLWMSPSSMPTSTTFPDVPPQHSLHTLSSQSTPTSFSVYAESGRSTAPTSASSPKTRADAPLDDHGPKGFPSPIVSGSPDLKSMDLPGADADPEKLAREDPLATQVWKMYARTKATLPHAQRMENLTWRMMALALKKKKEDEDRAKSTEQKSSETVPNVKSEPAASPAPLLAIPRESIRRGRTTDKGKARVQVNEVVPMDWRAMSRSRSRVPMDWRPASRSRSRPPMSGLLSEQNLIRFPSSTSPSKGLSMSPSIPIPGTSSSSSSGRRSPYTSLPGHLGLPALYESATESARTSPFGHLDSTSALNSPAGHPTSLPSTGLHGLSKITTSNLPAPEQRSFPRHVRKTSFDHTVAKDGIFTGLSGRHQVNGKPASPETLLGQKRRADAPHAESMLRGDPPAVDLARAMELESDFRRSSAGSPFPTASFNFSFPAAYDTFFDLSGAANTLHSSSYSTPMPPSNHHRSYEASFSESMRSSLNEPYSPTIGSVDGGLSAAAAAASAAVAEGYAQVNVTNMGMDDSGLDYHHLVSMMYPGLDSGAGLGPFTHVDPTQILPVDNPESAFPSFHASPSSDGWGNGVNSSSNASPEPYNTSTASTPPSGENTAGARNQPRKIASSKRMSQDVSARSGSGAQRKPTPDSSGQNSKDDGDQPPTICTNCQTTNTPLWRRDPEGQPLCTYFHLTIVPEDGCHQEACVAQVGLDTAQDRSLHDEWSAIQLECERALHEAPATDFHQCSDAVFIFVPSQGERGRYIGTSEPILASLFRQQPSPRSPIPPSSFPTGLQPVASNDVNATITRRISRTDLDFEQALRGGGTVVLREGLDVDTLGADLTNSSISFSPFSSPSPSDRPYFGVQPATPTVVPPTPSPAALGRVAGPSTPSIPRPSFTSSSSNEVFYDAEDSDFQTKRRSMYRSPGTASSPDLATLLRKAKERGKQDGRKGATAASPDGSPTKIDASKGSSRQRSSTSSSLAPPLPSMQGSPALRGKPSISTNLANSSSASSEWVLTSPRSLSSIKEGGAKSKSSVRAKTSAFLGKMLGSSSTRDRQRSLTSSPSSTSIAAYPGHQLMDAFTPPVPPLPKEVQEARPRPSVQTDASDVFSSASGVSDKSKPLPAIRNSALYSETECSDEQSVVMVEPPRDGSPSPTTTVKGKSSRNSKVAARNKRRSMSVSDADLKRVMAAGSSSGPVRVSNDGKRPDVWDSTLNGILSEFKGELSQLDPISTSSLDLRDPSTPSRRLQVTTRANSEGASTSAQTIRPIPKTTASLPLHLNTPTVTLHPAATEDESILNAVLSSPTRDSSSSEGPIVPPRVSSLHTPLRSRSGSSATSQQRVPSLKYGPRTPPFRNGASPTSHTHSASRDANRLRVQHRSTASSSEPSLIPEPADGRQDLTSSELVATRFNANRSSPGRGEETADLEARGKELASRCWAEDEEFLAKDKIAEWLGGMSPINKTALRHYVDFFDFSNLRLDNAFRRLCAKLFLKAETQQVDRILEEFSRRYWECNPTSVYGNASVVHAVAYSLLLLNTDLHVAELVNKMSRGQFVRNTIAAIQMQLQPNPSPNTEFSYDDWSSFRAGSEGSDLAGSTLRSRPKRSDSMTSWSSITRDGFGSQPAIGAKAGNSTGQLSNASDPPGPSPANGSSVSVAMSSGHAQDTKIQDVKDTKSKETTPITTTVTYDRNWEAEMESLLKASISEMYTAIKNQQILQPIGSSLMARSSTSSLSPHGPLLRNRSLRGGQPDRLTTLKRGSIRGLQSILGGPSGISPYSSNSSIDGRASPAPSFATSNEGFHASTASFLTPSMGFASNLSHTIIRETQEDDHSIESGTSVSDDISITDEELALLGPPWAKEGMLCRKQYWESAGKRAKSKTWLDVFVVIQKGDLSMFTFGEHGAGGGGVVGGGNWLENAHSVGAVQLAHSLAHALPPPGYNRQRPHCMVLTLANGGVYFFQAGTEELVNEWVSTCNYWAARQSKEPLAGGVSNMEYGWNRVIKSLSRGRAASEDNISAEPDNSDGVSIRSGRSGRSRLKEIAATVRAEKSPWTDRTFINDWKPPMHPTVPSTHDEETQLEALQKHVDHLKKDLKQHNELRAPMTQLYQPRSSNGAKALSNWEKKSQYLLTEIVKYESYIDSLQAAMTLRLKRRGEKAMEKALVVSSPVNEEPPVEKGRWKGQPEEETIEEDEEPPPSASNSQNISVLLMHRRELAQMGEETDDED
ncbi:hypothetical protein OBBRIDRAFT_810024 [Obba rivulosa]|uniref:SEC7 domain-containing protein n=1 Tax=Obba rivulosa TaxID=1052685 RepID=A0A8E2DSX7_9APHY|nr:hypothetical protein OBBRIDRAFT_810024 [Obba rivulosa]